MQLQILSVPENGKPWTQKLKAGDTFDLTPADVAMDLELDFFKDNSGWDHSLRDLILNSIEFKVIHEKAE